MHSLLPTIMSATLLALTLTTSTLAQPLSPASGQICLGLESTLQACGDTREDVFEKLKRIQDADPDLDLDRLFAAVKGPEPSHGFVDESPHVGQ